MLIFVWNFDCKMNLTKAFLRKMTQYIEFVKLITLSESELKNAFGDRWSQLVPFGYQPNIEKIEKKLKKSGNLQIQDLRFPSKIHILTNKKF